MDATLVSEGVETLAELEVLRDIGVELGQGYLFKRPARTSRRRSAPPGARRRAPHPPPAQRVRTAGDEETGPRMASGGLGGA